MAQLLDTANVKKVSARSLFSELHKIPTFAQTSEQDLECLGEIEVLEIPADTVLYNSGDGPIYFWIVLHGKLRAYKNDSDGSEIFINSVKEGDTFGEVALLTGHNVPGATCETTANCTLVRVPPEGFWQLMSTCPIVRRTVLDNMARRLESYTALTLHREKLISLGTLAAGLMHELNNPGAAAKRAASQLRDNMTRQQKLSLRMSRAQLSPQQLECLAQLQEEVFGPARCQTMSSLEQSDAEEALTEWLESIGVENAWKMAPTLVAAGWSRADVECTQAAFPPDVLSDAMNWLEALISNVQLVGTIEESIARVSELVMAVKKYAYEDKNKQHKLDIHDTIKSTLTILGHKFRQKQIIIEKQFAAGVPVLTTCGTGISQVWTNLLDNAIDASPEPGKITVRTWLEDDWVYVGISDQGSGIPPENQDRVFEPFFTTKPLGIGTGLGLDIAKRIVTGHYGGEISFTSEPGHTEFVVKLPVGEAKPANP
ncbi:MAG TPA: ATP-binding protein [Alloacidobacterium sp.]|nr:ATP-binding protein [Alloacidobacterium sp.]